MRDYIQHEAAMRRAYGAFSGLVRLWKNWKLRGEMRQLLSWSDYELRDIGLTRSDLLGLHTRPRDCDLQWEKERRDLSWSADDLQGQAAPDKAGSSQVHRPAISKPAMGPS